MSDLMIEEIPQEGGVKHEPPVPALIRKGFLFLPTAGMREAPEKLITELFREIFFEKFSERKSEQQLNPECEEEGAHVFNKEERAVLYATRGRKKKSKWSPVAEFYAPAYPVLAAHSWLRESSDRVIRDHLFGGPIAQHMKDNNQEALDKAILLWLKAFTGHRSATAQEFKSKDILSVAIKDVPFKIDEALCSERIRGMVLEGGAGLSLGFPDLLAARISNDLHSVCELEAELPRMQWLGVLKCFLRISLSTWILSHMRLTLMLRDWVIQAIDCGTVETEQCALDRISSRHRELFHPTTTPTNEITRHVELYMKARVELNILLYATQPFLGEGFLKKNSLVTTELGSGRVSISQLLERLATVRSEFPIRYGLGARQLATRVGERYSAWTAPLKKGQGKNIDEFLRVLRRSEADDGDDGYLLTPVKGKGFMVFPGPMLLRTFAFLAGREKERGEKHERGKLVLADIEAHFKEYGVEFGVTAGARPRLIVQLAEMGLLKGSPDAGDSAEVLSPYRVSEEHPV